MLTNICDSRVSWESSMWLHSRSVWNDRTLVVPQWVARPSDRPSAFWIQPFVQRYGAKPLKSAFYLAFEQSSNVITGNAVTGNGRDDISVMVNFILLLLLPCSSFIVFLLLRGFRGTICIYVCARYKSYRFIWLLIILYTVHITGPAEGVSAISLHLCTSSVYLKWVGSELSSEYIEDSVRHV